MRNRVLFTAFALLCGASTAFAGGVAVPKGEWTVGPINAASSSGVGYCSMKTEYTNGNTLVFARDAEGSNSLAIDFHKKSLETGGQYTVGLKVGSLQRDMLAIAATPSVIIIQMGLDRDFYLTLQRRPTLQVDFQTSQMSFSLDGTKDGMAALTSCAQAVGKRKKFAEVRVPLTKAVDERALAATEPAAGGAPVMPPANFPEQKLSAENLAREAQQAAQGAFSGTLGDQAVQATLDDQIAQLKAENRRLLAENNRVAETMQSNSVPQMQAVPEPPVESAPLPPVQARLAIPAQPSFTSSNDVTAALTAAQQGIQQALEAQQAQADAARRQADLAAENARLKASLVAAQAQADAARKQAEMLAENAKLKDQLAAEQQAKQRALEAAQAQAAEASRQAAIAAENARLKAQLIAIEQEKQRAMDAARVKAADDARTQAARQAALEAQQREAVAAQQRAQAAAQAAAAAEAQRAQAAAALQRQQQADAAAVNDDAQAEPAPKPQLKLAIAEQPKPAIQRKSLQIVGAPDGFIQQLLTQSHVTGLQDPRNPGTWTWSAAGVKGVAEEQDLSGANLNDAVNDYVQRQASRCKGDFAHNIRPGKSVDGAQYMEGEIACMNGVADAASAVLFISRNGKLDIISHAGPPSRMEKALSERDTMISALAK
jgi:hypothetical protein